MSTRKMKKNTNKGFTLIEAMIVIFIIGLLSFIGAIGFGKVNRQKMIEKASSKISFELNSTRNSSFFGKVVNNKYPCGYGIAIRQGKSDFQEIYTSGSGLDRVGAMESDTSCDDLIKNKEIDIAEAPVSDPSNLTLDKVSIERVDKVNNNQLTSANCLVILFSAPRGNAYYCVSNSACPPSKCTFQAFSESGSLNSDLFLATLLVSEGSNNARSCLSLYPSGNTGVKADVDSCVQ